ncbi:MAG: esterase [Rubrivivax sp.]
MQSPIDWLPEQGAPQQLILLLHGYGADGRSMAPLAQALRGHFAHAALVAADAPSLVADDATARCWYDTAGLTPDNWADRVEAALPPLRDWIRLQQQRLGVGPAATALAGFSQGAVLALALALQPDNDGLVGRVLAFNGALASPPLAAPRQTTVHLFHGDGDTVIPPEGSRQALRLLGALQGDATLDIAAGVGHDLHPALIDSALQRLQTHIPLRTWQAALGSVPAVGPDGALPS